MKQSQSRLMRIQAYPQIVKKKKKKNQPNYMAK